MTSRRIPTLPAAARKAGATSIKRTLGSSFAVGFKFDGKDYSTPGNGPAVVAALQAAWSDRADISWGGRQADAIFVSFR